MEHKWHQYQDYCENCLYDPFEHDIPRIPRKDKYRTCDEFLAAWPDIQKKKEEMQERKIQKRRRKMQNRKLREQSQSVAPNQ